MQKKKNKTGNNAVNYTGDTTGVPCPLCGSDNTLPYEDETGITGEPSIFIIILTALVLVGSYFAFVVTSYMYFPIVIFIAIIISTRFVNRGERRSKRTGPPEEKNHICLSCNRSFTRSEKH